MTTSEVELVHAGPVATVTLRRPDVLNAQTPATWLALRDIGRELPGDVRVVVVRGEGRAFSSGLDISGGGPSFIAEITALPPDAAADRILPYQEGFTWLHRPDIISVAAVQGHAIGAGFQLALACDLRVLADDAQLTMAEVTLGLVPDLGGTKRLVELVGYARALEICLTARRLPAAEALSLGLATAVVPRDDLDGAVSDLVAAVLAGPRNAVVEIKALLAGAAGRSWPAQLAAEREAQVRRLRDLAGLGE
ncbi:enoyl-CoA hydratase/isomerase family protein [Asanoa siamensis]|uniref:Enoyl-CoA hydratase n=1 Tax=Asanoa siamensis TaxID=926357 RepID=A0ABQ4CN52_9ACTN|nr:enoyl-CoA hydratase/isomerase family protein [Asanoa siamensis]GIF72714.1 enoyl-CoA hydratase [Asanoa siamensis]